MTSPALPQRGDLELAAGDAPAPIEALGARDSVTVYLARLTSPESRRAMATSLELLAELLVDGHPADRAERARRHERRRPGPGDRPG